MPTENLARYGAAGVLALLLAGCATTDDPRQGGFVSGLYNTVLTDGYKQRENREQVALHQEAGRQSALQRRAGELQRQRDELRQQVAALQQQAGTLDRRLQALRSQTISSRDSVQREKVELAIQRLEAVKLSLKSTDWQQQPVADANGRLKEIKLMMQDVTEVAEAGR